jgi:hypothetical protein
MPLLCRFLASPAYLLTLHNKRDGIAMKLTQVREMDKAQDQPQQLEMR